MEFTTEHNSSFTSIARVAAGKKAVFSDFAFLYALLFSKGIFAGSSRSEGGHYNYMPQLHHVKEHLSLFPSANALAWFARPGGKPATRCPAPVVCIGNRAVDPGVCLLRGGVYRNAQGQCEATPAPAEDASSEGTRSLTGWATIVKLTPRFVVAEILIGKHNREGQHVRKGEGCS